MLSSFAAVIFDLDGVLIDSEPLHERAQRLVFARYGLDVPDAVFEDFKGKTEEDIFHHVLTTFSDDSLDAASLIAEKHETYETIMQDLVMLDDARVVLDVLNEHGLPLGLTTSATQANQQRVFMMFELAPYFSVVVTVADITKPKPDPAPYIKTADLLGVEPERCLVVEDTVAGVQAARAAGCTVAALTTTFPRALLIDAGAHAVFDSFSELAEWLEVKLPA